MLEIGVVVALGGSMIVCTASTWMVLAGLRRDVPEMVFRGVCGFLLGVSMYLAGYLMMNWSHPALGGV